jgi:hypothetical protein
MLNGQRGGGRERLSLRDILSLAYRKRRLAKKDVEAVMRLYKEEKLFEKDLEVFWNLKRKRRLASKDFLELYDLIWEDSAPVKYQNPDSWLGPDGRTGEK